MTLITKGRAEIHTPISVKTEAREVAFTRYLTKNSLEYIVELPEGAELTYDPYGFHTHFRILSEEILIAK